MLADIVAKVSGQPFDQFVATRLFKPLGMTDSMFKPPSALRSRIAPTGSAPNAAGHVRAPVRKCSRSRSRSHPAGWAVSRATQVFSARRKT